MSFLSAQWHVQTNGILHQNFVGYAIDTVNVNTAAFIIHTDTEKRDIVLRKKYR